MAISVGLSDREAFVDKVASLIDSKVGADPEAARAFGDNVAVWLESLRGELFMQDMFASKEPSGDSGELAEEVKKLRESIDRLAESLNKR